MKLSDFLKEIEEKQMQIVYLCVSHILKKQYNIENDNVDYDILKEFFVNYSNYDRYLNDYANTIYNRYESSNDEIYEAMCNYFNESSDNKYLFEYRLKRVENQDPTKYLSIEDEDMRNAAIYRVEDKIKTIKDSLYYKDNADVANEHIEKLEKKIDLIKKAVGLV